MEYDASLAEGVAELIAQATVGAVMHRASVGRQRFHELYDLFSAEVSGANHLRDGHGQESEDAG